MPTVFSNRGNGFIFVANSAAITGIQRAAVETKLVERLVTLNAEYGDLNSGIVRTADGNFQLQTQYPCADGLGLGALRDRLKALLQQTRFMHCDVYDAQAEADFVALRVPQGGKLGKLSKAEFSMLYPAFKDPAFEKQGDAPGGQWVIVNSDD